MNQVLSELQVLNPQACWSLALQLLKRKKLSPRGAQRGLCFPGEGKMLSVLVPALYNCFLELGELYAIVKWFRPCREQNQSGGVIQRFAEESELW